MTAHLPASWAWVPHVFAIELKKALSYRMAFWIQFLVGTATEIGVAYFLWKAIFSVRGEETLAGFTFSGILYYTLFASFALKIARGSEEGYLARDIYDGGLTRYLVYPLPLAAFKYVTHLTQQMLVSLQLLLAFLLLQLFLPLPSDHRVSVSTVIAGTLTCFLAGYLHFLLTCCLEMVAFWQDVIWNLLAMLRFAMGLLGGVMIPLAFFPEWGQRLVTLTPFPSIVTFPAKTFLGQVSLQEWGNHAGILVCWSVIFTFVAMWIWNRGTKQYSGVGI